MKTVILSAQDPFALPRALEILQMGGLVAFPTDTVYGVGALAFNGAAVESIYTAKDRPVEKAIPILIGDVDDLVKVSAEVPEIALKTGCPFLARTFDPGGTKTPRTARSRLRHADSRCAHPGPSCGACLAAPGRTDGCHFSQPFRSAKSHYGAGSLCPARWANRTDHRRRQDTRRSPIHRGGLCWCRAASFARRTDPQK